MLSSVLQKLQEDQARALVIAPLWRTQVWFPQMCQMLISQPVPLPKEASLLQLPHDRTKQHPLWPKLQRMACLLSGRDSDNKTFQRELVVLYFGGTSTLLQKCAYTPQSICYFHRWFPLYGRGHLWAWSHGRGRLIFYSVRMHNLSYHCCEYSAYN